MYTVALYTGLYCLWSWSQTFSSNQVQDTFILIKPGPVYFYTHQTRSRILLYSSNQVHDTFILIKPGPGFFYTLQTMSKILIYSSKPGTGYFILIKPATGYFYTHQTWSRILLYSSNQVLKLFNPYHVKLIMSNYNSVCIRVFVIIFWSFIQNPSTIVY